MAHITALTAPIVTTLAMSRLTAATVVCVLATVWGASAAHAQSAGAEAYGEVSTAVSQSFQRLIAAVVKVLPAAISAVIVLAVFWVLATLVRRVARAGAQCIDDQTTRLLVTQVTYYLVWAVGFSVALDAVGVNLQSAVTALGLGSVAIGFALKDILSNLVSGILILAMHPFEIGDQIVIGDTEGTVEADRVSRHVYPHVRREACARPQRRGVHLAHHEQHGFAAETSVGIRTPRLQRGHGARAVNDSRHCQVVARGCGHAAAVHAPAGSPPQLHTGRGAVLDGLPAHESDERGVGCSGGHPPGVEGNRHSAAGSGPANSYDPVGFGEDGKRRRAPEYSGGNGRSAVAVINGSGSE